MPATNTFATQNGAGLESSAEHAFSITPNDSADLAFVTRAIYVGGAGNLTVVMLGGEEETFANVQAGMVYEFRVSRVKAAGTTATNLKGLY